MRTIAVTLGFVGACLGSTALADETMCTYAGTKYSQGVALQDGQRTIVCVRPKGDTYATWTVDNSDAGTPRQTCMYENRLYGVGAVLPAKKLTMRCLATGDWDSI